MLYPLPALCCKLQGARCKVQGARNTSITSFHHYPTLSAVKATSTRLNSAGSSNIQNQHHRGHKSLAAQHQSYCFQNLCTSNLSPPNSLHVHQCYPLLHWLIRIFSLSCNIPEICIELSQTWFQSTDSILLKNKKTKDTGCPNVQ